MATKNIYIPPDGDPKKLPHFSNIPQATGLWEPLYKNLFEVNFVLPQILRDQGRDPLLLLYTAKNISMNFTPTLGTQVQNYKFSGRVYSLPPTPEQTVITDLSIGFNLNQNDKNQVVVYNTLKAWYDLQWNSQDGTMNYKRDVVGYIIANWHDKRGEVIRRAVFNNVQILGLSQFDLAWSDTAIVDDMTAVFAADHFSDIYIDDFNSDTNG
jgi:hypothetical protein